MPHAEGKTDQESTLKKPINSGEKNEPEKELVFWKAPARPFKKRDREFYITAIAIAAIVGLVLFLVEGFMPVILLTSIVFLYYVMSTVEPESVEYKISNKGIKVSDKRTDWGNFTRFWFSKRFDSELLVIETIAFPGRFELVIKPELKEELKKILTSYIPEEEVPPSFLDKAANWFSKKLPGNK